MMTKNVSNTYIQVEYDPEFFGGDYHKVGSFVYIPTSLVDNFVDSGAADPLMAAFKSMTGLDPVHVVYYTVDELYYPDGQGSYTDKFDADDCGCGPA